MALNLAEPFCQKARDKAAGCGRRRHSHRPILPDGTFDLPPDVFHRGNLALQSLNRLPDYLANALLRFLSGNSIGGKRDQATN